MSTTFRGAVYRVTTLLGAQASRRAILDLLREQARAAGPDGLLLVYFAGHGQVDPDDPNTAYLLPADADPAALSATAIPLDDVARRHLTLAGTAFTLLDCCHSGYAVGLRGGAVPATAGREFGQSAQSNFAGARNRVVLTACAGDQLARELTRLGHGVFTYYILEWWRTSPYGDDLSLSRYVISRVVREQVPSPVRGGVQDGLLLLREGGPAGSAGLADVPAQAPAAPASTVPWPNANVPAWPDDKDSGPSSTPFLAAPPAAPAPAPARTVTLDRAMRRPLYDALLAAFPAAQDLQQMVRFGLDENLSAIAGGSALSDIVFNLIQWAEARGRVGDLVAAALEANPRNPALRTVAGALGFPPT
jgi:hypothetical protein